MCSAMTWSRWLSIGNGSYKTLRMNSRLGLWHSSTARPLGGLHKYADTKNHPGKKKVDNYVKKKMQHRQNSKGEKNGTWTMENDTNCT